MSVVHGRDISGQVEEFGVSGYVYKNVFVIYDRKTESLWWPLDDSGWTAVSGPRKNEKIPFLEEKPLVTLKEWREKHPKTLVLIGSKAKLERNDRNKVAPDKKKQ